MVEVAICLSVGIMCFISGYHLGSYDKEMENFDEELEAIDREIEKQTIINSFNKQRARLKLIKKKDEDNIK